MHKTRKQNTYHTANKSGLFFRVETLWQDEEGSFKWSGTVTRYNEQGKDIETKETACQSSENDILLLAGYKIDNANWLLTKAEREIKN